ncbi:hypothetical protein L914_02132 [Phytophthora nicotianae]|uniref:Uncharacterized protein n=1 Tax=Phytophthora nicotianae TaxID=4792 RepID=W2P157_PHYNI|nr:hypothetical protein L914_02132 [Phytophthora nicotianae]
MNRTLGKRRRATDPSLRDRHSRPRLDDSEQDEDSDGVGAPPKPSCSQQPRDALARLFSNLVS